MPPRCRYLHVGEKRVRDAVTERYGDRGTNLLRTGPSHTRWSLSWPRRVMKKHEQSEQPEESSAPSGDSKQRMMTRQPVLLAQDLQPCPREISHASTIPLWRASIWAVLLRTLDPRAHSESLGKGRWQTEPRQQVAGLGSVGEGQNWAVGESPYAGERWTSHGVHERWVQRASRSVCSVQRYGTAE